MRSMSSSRRYRDTTSCVRICVSASSTILTAIYPTLHVIVPWYIQSPMRLAQTLHINNIKARPKSNPSTLHNLSPHKLKLPLLARPSPLQDPSRLPTTSWILLTYIRHRITPLPRMPRRLLRDLLRRNRFCLHRLRFPRRHVRISNEQRKLAVQRRRLRTIVNLLPLRAIHLTLRMRTRWVRGVTALGTAPERHRRPTHRSEITLRRSCRFRTKARTLRMPGVSARCLGGTMIALRTAITATESIRAQFS